METYAASVLSQVQVAYSASPAIAYTLVALGTTMFGNLVAVPAVLLGFGGGLGRWGVIGAPLATLGGQLVGDAVWFTLGYRLAGTRAGMWIKERLPRHKRVEEFFDGGSPYILAASKLFAAPTTPILFLLGWAQTDVRRYAKLSLLSAGIWFVSILAFCGLVYSGIEIIF